jgi:predicted MPP superfamily phosphohydrolase
MKNRDATIFSILIAALFSLLPVFSVAGNIVYPWRAVPAFSKAGDRFEILFNNINYSEIDSVVLTGPYNRVSLTIDSVFTGRFEYDSFTKQSVNNKIRVRVPESTPEELYSLAIYSAGETFISPKSVKVVRQFNPSHCFIHISDPHISRQWVGTAENGYAKELELLDRFVEVANIIAPDFIIVTGDVIHQYTLFDADSTGWGGTKNYDPDQRPLAEEKYKNYFEGAKGFSGIHGLNSPVFSLPGNHDFYGVSRTDHLAMASQWNHMCGKRVYGFSYAGTRVIAADDFLGDPITDIPDTLPMSGLQGKVFKAFFDENGPGKFRILAQHRPDRVDTVFLNKFKINILLNGHLHNPFSETVGNTPTLSIRPGTVCRSGEISRWKETLGFFRIFTIKEDTFGFSPALRICKDPTVPYEELKMNLTLNFLNPNDGNFRSNEAILSNAFELDLPKCKIRFVMEKGEYSVSGGTIQQIIVTDTLSIVDVYADVPANTTKKVNISCLKY